MRASSFTILLIVVLMVIIILALIVIIGLTIMLGTGSAGTEAGPFMEFVRLVKDQVLVFVDCIQQWIEFFMSQIQKLSQAI